MFNLLSRRWVLLNSLLLLTFQSFETYEDLHPAMVTSNDYRRQGVQASVLGLHFSNWTKQDLQTMLRHYGRSYRPEATKMELMRRLNSLSQRIGLDRDDRIEVLGKGKARGHATDATRRFV